MELQPGDLIYDKYDGNMWLYISEYLAFVLVDNGRPSQFKRVQVGPEHNNTETFQMFITTWPNKIEVIGNISPENWLQEYIDD